MAEPRTPTASAVRPRLEYGRSGYRMRFSDDEESDREYGSDSQCSEREDESGGGEDEGPGDSCGYSSPPSDGEDLRLHAIGNRTLFPGSASRGGGGGGGGSRGRGRGRGEAGGGGTRGRGRGRGTDGISGIPSAPIRWMSAARHLAFLRGEGTPDAEGRWDDASRDVTDGRQTRMEDHFSSSSSAAGSREGSPERERVGGEETRRRGTDDVLDAVQDPTFPQNDAVDARLARDISAARTAQPRPPNGNPGGRTEGNRDRVSFSYRLPYAGDEMDDVYSSCDESEEISAEVGRTRGLCVFCEVIHTPGDPLRSKAMDKIEELVDYNYGRMHTPTLAKMAHAMWKKEIYGPAKTEGKEVYMWRTADAYLCMKYHSRNPRRKMVDDLDRVDTGLQISMRQFSYVDRDGGVRLRNPRVWKEVGDLIKLRWGLLYKTDVSKLGYGRDEEYGASDARNPASSFRPAEGR